MKYLTPTVLLAASAFVYPGSAAGEPDDDARFLGALNAAGFTYDTDLRVISVGHGMCYFVDQGAEENTLVSILRENNSALTAERARQFATIALETYCPKAVAL